MQEVYVVVFEEYSSGHSEDGGYCADFYSSPVVVTTQKDIAEEVVKELNSKEGKHHYYKIEQVIIAETLDQARIGADLLRVCARCRNTTTLPPDIYCEPCRKEVIQDFKDSE